MNKRERQKRDSENIIFWVFLTTICLGVIYGIVYSILKFLN